MSEQEIKDSELQMYRSIVNDLIPVIFDNNATEYKKMIAKKKIQALRILLAELNASKRPANVD